MVTYYFFVTSEQTWGFSPFMLIYLRQYEKGLPLRLPYRLSKVKLDVAIKPIPIIPITVAMPVVFSPRISPLNIKKALANARTSPVMNSGRNVFLLLGCFNFPRLRNAIKATATNMRTIAMIMIGGPSLISNLCRL
jgi:hypothetical protein